MDTQNEMNPYTDDFDKASEHLRQALALLSKHKIPPSPLNYRIGYDAAAGRNERLRQEFENRLNSPAGISQEALWQLYANHFLQDDETLEQLRKDLRILVTSLQQEFSRAGGNIAGYADTLNRFAGILESESSIVQITAEVHRVIEDTRHMERSQTRLESQMSGVMQEMESMRQELEQVRQESLVDGLTGAANRKAFDQVLNQRLEAAPEQNLATCLLLADIDHFKQFNDNHGHLVGDKVLRYVASILLRCVKETDTVARYGGEEFALILPDRDIDAARQVAEQIRREVSSASLVNKSRGENYGTISISIGIALLQPDDQPEDLIQRADQALYLAKNRGRNRVEYVET